MKHSNQTPTISDYGKIGKRLGITVTIGLIVLICGLFFGLRACSDQYHAQYATGEQYTISGYVVKAIKRTDRFVGENDTRHTSYNVELQMLGELPNGDKVFKTNKPEEYDVVSRFANHPDTLVVFTISADGYLIGAEETEEGDGDNNGEEADSDGLPSLENMSDEEIQEKLLEIWKERNRK